MGQLRPTPKRRRADCRALRKIRQLPTIQADKRVAYIFAWKIRIQQKSCRLFNGHILHGVHGDIDLAGQKVFFDFSCEQTLAADFAQ